MAKKSLRQRVLSHAGNKSRVMHVLILAWSNELDPPEPINELETEHTTTLANDKAAHITNKEPGDST